MTAADRLNGIFRGGILAAAGNPVVSGFVSTHGMRLGAARFVAGENLDDAVETLRRLEADGLWTNTTILGEHVEDAAAAEAVAAQYEVVIDRLAAEGLRTNVALKLTHLGLDLGEQVARDHLARLLAHTARYGGFIRIDMEEAVRVEATLRVFRDLREVGHDNLGTVLQSYLHRTPADLEALADLRPNLRIVKGAYREPPELALPDKRDVDVAYVEVVRRALKQGCYVCVATHDEAIIDDVRAWTAAQGIGRERFEFQMLYGVRPDLQRALTAEGYKVLVATPYGPEWYPYLMRRLAERPANLTFLLRNVLRGA